LQYCIQLVQKTVNPVFKQNAPEVSLVKVNDAGDTTVAADNLAAALQANDDIVGVFCVDGVAGTAGPTAVAESKKDLRVLAFDVDVTVLDKVKSGEIILRQSNSNKKSA